MNKLNLCFTTRNNKHLSTHIKPQTQTQTKDANKSLSFHPISSKNRPANIGIITYMNLEALMTSKPCGSCGSR